MNLWLPWLQGGEEQGKGKNRGKFGMDTYTLLYFKWIINMVLLHSTGNSAQCYVTIWIQEEYEGEWIHVHIWLSPFAVHLKLSQHC